jgi:predicted RecA/RadA family phage recombinase
MARNEVFKEANYLTLPVPVGTKSGAPVRVGGLNGVAQVDEPTAYINGQLTPEWNEAPSSNRPGYASVALKGAFRLPVATATTLAVGAPVYIKPDNTLTTTDSSGANALFGHALSVKGTSAGQDVIVRIAN